MEKRKFILRNFLSPGDLVMLTAAVRDLHRCYPGRFLTDVRTSCPELWEHNPHLTPLREDDPLVEQIDCHYPLIDRSNDAPYHCLHGFAQFLNEKLSLDVRPTRFAGDIHLSGEERRWKSTVHELAGRDLPFWIINAGGKFDYTIKWWDWRRYQQVVDHFRGKILFVQVGDLGHYHPLLRHVIDLRGRTDLRQFVRLVYHAQGVLCGVTALMHLAAAVPTRPDRPPLRAAVVVAGGREPTHWEAYTHHQFIHTIGALPCCASGGCWRARTHPLGDGEKHDHPRSVCSNVTGDLPRCMDMIAAAEVIRRIETYFHGGANRFLTAAEARAAGRAIARSLKGPRFDTTLNLLTAPAAVEKAAAGAKRAKAPAMKGRGVLVTLAALEEGSAAVDSARAVRALDSLSPIECWTSVNLPPAIAESLRSLAVTVRRAVTFVGLTGPELRQHALAHTRLRAVIVLAPGVCLRVAPGELFDARAFRRTGALFGVRGKFTARPGVWKLCRLPPPSQTADPACFVIERARCWSALTLWRWMLQHAYFFKGYVDGDGGAAQLAFTTVAQRISLKLPRAAFTCSGPATPSPR